MAISVLDYTLHNSAELYKVTDADIAETFYEVGKWYGKIKTQRLTNAYLYQSGRPSPNDIWLLLSSIMEGAPCGANNTDGYKSTPYMSLAKIHQHISSQEFKTKGATETVCGLSANALEKTLREHGIVARLGVSNGKCQEYSVDEAAGILYIDPDWKRWLGSVAQLSGNDKFSRRVIYVCETERESSNRRARFRELLLCSEMDNGPQTLFMMRLYRQKKWHAPLSLNRSR